MNELKTNYMNQVRDLKLKLAELDKKKTETQNSLDVVTNKLTVVEKDYSTDQSDLLAKKGELSELRNQLKNNESRITEIMKQIDQSNEQVTLLTREISELDTVSNTYKAKLTVLNFIKSMTSRDFRGYLLNGVISYINQKLAHYSNCLFGTDALSVQLDGNKLLINFNNRNYENLSGGERQRADLAIQFSLRDLLINSMGFRCNLLVLDEGFDNLDDSGVSALIDVISQIKEVDSIFTITHHTMSLPFDKTIHVVKGIDNITNLDVSYCA